jgi:uncharacterized protein (TIGR03086 family)
MAEQNVFRLMPAALRRFGARVHEIPAAAWDAPTPCTEWSVRDLVNHVTVEQLWAPHLLRGETLDEVGDRYDGDQLGADPTGMWDRAAEDARKAWEAAGDDASVDTSMGPLPVREYAEQMHLDLLVHGWDLARGAGLDPALPADSVEHALAFVEPRAEEFAGYGVFAPPVDVASTDPADRLLALLGRAPR